MLTIKELVRLSLLSSLMMVAQVGMAFLPNIELVSLLCIGYTLSLGKKALYVIYIFVLMQGLLYGFGLWWLCYLYVWTILWGATMLLSSMEAPLGWAVVSGLFGLFFGMLTALPYLLTGGYSMAFAYWVNGIPFDIAHCIGNFAAALILLKPLRRILEGFLKG